GDDLCGLPRRGLNRRRQSGDSAAVHLAILQVSAQPTTGGVSVGGQPEGFMKNIPAKNPRLRLDSTSYGELHRQVLERDGLAMPGLRKHAEPSGAPPQT